MAHRVHHLNCATMNTPAGRMVCHCLLVETDDAGLVLVDSGVGEADFADPGTRMGPIRHLLGFAGDEAEFAVNQVRALGFSPEDVRHIVLTHMDFDHAGGIADFPHADIHVTSAEALGATMGRTRFERIRYNAAQFAHGPRLVEHTPYGELWRGFAAAKELTENAEGIVLISLPGHSRGHAGVAVDAGDRWVLHCGDLFDHRDEVFGCRRDVPLAIRTLARIEAFDLDAQFENQRRVRELWERGEPDLLIVNAHDPVLLEQARALPVA